MGIRPINIPSRDLQTLFSVGTVGGFSDGQHLGRFAARRDEAAFETLIRRHGPMVWGVCRRILRDHHDAEDAFQATFLVLARKAPSIADRELVANWLYAVAYKSAMRARAMASKRRARERQVAVLPEPEPGVEERRDDLLSQLDQELSRLPDKYRVPIVLCELEGKTHREAAEQLKWPIGTVSGRLSRARAILARRLSRPGMNLSVGSLAVLLTREAVSAGMPARLMDSTARFASLSAAGRPVTAGMVSAEVTALMEGVLKTMALSKIKNVLLILAALTGIGTLGTGVAVMTPWASAAEDEPLLTAAVGGTTSAERHSQPKVKKAKYDEALKKWAYPHGGASEVWRVDGSSGTGRYETVDPFHEVVRFYVEKSGLESPDWRSLGRKFPEAPLQAPDMWTTSNKLRSVSLHHHIRADSASAALVKSDFESGETISVSISRGLKDERTLIQVTRHARK